MTKEYIDKNAVLMLLDLIECPVTKSEEEIIKNMPTLNDSPEDYGLKIMELEKVLVKYLMKNTKYNTPAMARRRACKAINMVVDDE